MLERIESFLTDFIQMQAWIDRAYDFVSGMGPIEQLIGALVFVLVVFLGTFSLIKKLSKLIIVAAVLFALWLLYSQGYFG